MTEWLLCAAIAGAIGLGALIIGFAMLLVLTLLDIWNFGAGRGPFLAKAVAILYPDGAKKRRERRK